MITWKARSPPQLFRGLRQGTGHAAARHLLSGVASPAGAGGDDLALHEERVGGELRAIADDDAVVGPRADADGAAVADGDVVGLEGAVLLGVGLEPGGDVEG